jgi:hypothetical protein
MRRLIFSAEKRRYGNDDRFLQPLSDRRTADPTAAPRRFCQKPAHLAGKEVVMREVKPISSKKVSEEIVEIN